MQAGTELASRPRSGRCTVWVVDGRVLASYLAVVSVLMLTPGPDMLFVLASGIRGGSRAGFVAAVGVAASTRRAFWRGLLTNVLNPKMALFTLALLPQFVDPSRGRVPAQLLLLGACFLALEIVVDGTVGLAAGRLRRVLVRRPGAARGVEVASGSVYLGLGAKLAVTR